MSAPPPEQPIYYSPAPAGGVVNPDGTQAQYQYVTPQQPSTPYQQPDTPYQQPGTPYQQPGTPYQQYSPQPGTADGTTLTQPFYAAQSPVPAQASQPVYTTASPVPGTVYAQPGYEQKPLDGQQQQGVYYAQQAPIQQQPQTFVVTTETTTDSPVITGDGTGLTGKMPQLKECCLCFPLHTGALIIAAVMTIYYGYLGINLFSWGIFVGVYISYIIFGVIYIMIAVVSGYGFVGIYKENPVFVDRFIKMFIVCSIIWFALNLLQMIILVANGFYLNWAWWIVNLLIAGLLQYYFCVCLVSYQRVLHARVGGGQKI
ncbi:hypothetical protein BX616_003651 [Lobosporangium transversale]|uniref:Uncharacterized protein n=1 Tax=Lobosporangium transversale TaxID=64571 RepID=A0A1Y2H372_9FUNG|nr:hypothetical protein BCR41DRAFT_367119 [Lobosporangium transversale]KAF9916476.1 hypothetical protein BX616_003651 [Lobosporangium transversale]ORZ28484.1 hypothetical protein BCR41DRAFT_367119 [Lobosporangium transversale]|eukprot:XP_021886169.1 hypothetical protein BCR41DRAFT_367119 [Lobosporangium transversale]